MTGGPGYFALDCSTWPIIADALTAAGRPWPEEAILADLRWWADQERLGRAARPGRPSLQRRWHVGDTVARRLMRAEEAWACPIQAAKAARLAADVAEAAARWLAEVAARLAAVLESLPTSARPARDQRPASRYKVQSRQSPVRDQRATSGRPAAGPMRGVQRSEAEGRSDPPPTPSEAEGDALGSLGPVLEAELPQLPSGLLSGLAQGTEAALRDLRSELRRLRRWPADAPRLRGPLARLVARRAEDLLGVAREREAAQAARHRAMQAARTMADLAYIGVDPPPLGEVGTDVAQALVELLGDDDAHAAICRAAVDVRVEADVRRSSPPPQRPPAVTETRADPEFVRQRLAQWRAARTS